MQKLNTSVGDHVAQMYTNDDLSYKVISGDIISNRFYREYLFNKDYSSNVRKHASRDMDMRILRTKRFQKVTELITLRPMFLHLPGMLSCSP